MCCRTLPFHATVQGLMSLGSCSMSGTSSPDSWHNCQKVPGNGPESLGSSYLRRWHKVEQNHGPCHPPWWWQWGRDPTLVLKVRARKAGEGLCGPRKFTFPGGQGRAGGEGGTGFGNSLVHEHRHLVTYQTINPPGAKGEASAWLRPSTDLSNPSSPAHRMRAWSRRAMPSGDF